MRFLIRRVVAPCLGLLLSGALASAQDWRGAGRIEGVVQDESGQPIADATIKAECPKRGGTTLKSDKKGRFVLGGVVGCNWAFDVEAAGYEAKKISVNLPGESARLQPVKVPLKKASAASASPELQAAAAKADAAYKEGRFADARAEYEKLLALRPDLAPTIYQQMGFSYVQEKQFDKAVESLEKVLAADPGNAAVRSIAAQAALEGKMVDKARSLLSTLDESQVQSADVFFNMGINFFNAGEAQDAITYFGKAIAKDPAHVDAYYRRALAYLGQGKSAEAKTDLQKVVELQPDGEMGAAAKKALEQIK
jgi:tetratricopeptide (TPR) repeat protein